MRREKRYIKKEGSKKQQAKLKAINKLQDEIAKFYYNTKYKKTRNN